MNIKCWIGLKGFDLFANKYKSRFVAGSALQDAVDKAKFFRERGEKAVINILGEHVKDRCEADWFCDQIIQLIILLNKEGLTDVNISEKPSQIGLGISEELYRDNKFLILSTARKYLPGAFVETDAEDFYYRKHVLQVAIYFNSEGFTNQLLCCQLNRNGALEEIQLLESAGIPARLCKGAYIGNIEKEDDLRKVFLTAVQARLDHRKWSVIATHDLFLIDSIARKFIGNENMLEFELLMGIEENLCKEPHFQHFSFRRYIPCDLNNNWRSYGKRRAEAIVDIWLRNFWYRHNPLTERRRNHAARSQDAL